MANQRNFQNFTYQDDQGRQWNKRGTLDAAINAIDGSTALTAGAPQWPTDTRRFHVRYAVFQDPTTGRTAKFPIYTPTAFAALVAGATVNINVPGNTAAVAYTLSQKVPERQPVPKSTRQLPDHP